MAAEAAAKKEAELAAAQERKRKAEQEAAERKRVADEQKAKAEAARQAAIEAKRLAVEAKRLELEIQNSNKRPIITSVDALAAGRTCETTDEALYGLANNRNPWGPICKGKATSVPNWVSVAAPATVVKAPAVATKPIGDTQVLPAYNQPIHLNRGLYNVVALSAQPFPQKAPATIPKIGTQEPPAIPRMGPGSQAEPTSSANCLSAETNGFDQSLSITPTSIQIRSNVQSSVKSKRASLGAAQLAIDVDEVRGSAIAESSITGASVSVDADAAVIRERACYGNISGTAELLSADAKASASIGPNGASAEASAGAYLAKDTGSMSIPIGAFNIVVSGDVGLGAGASAEVVVSATKGVKFGAEVAIGLDAGFEIGIQHR